MLANGVRIVGRSFKYHRPRGIYTAGPEEPNAILDLRHGARHDPNARATLEPLADGMELRSIHASGTAENDRLAFLDRLARFIPSAFYYKTFMWPNWTAYEHRIRALAGLGRVDPAAQRGIRRPIAMPRWMCAWSAPDRPASPRRWPPRARASACCWSRSSATSAARCAIARP